MQGSADETEYLPVGFGPGATVAGVSLNGKPRISCRPVVRREAWLAYLPSSTESGNKETSSALCVRVYSGADYILALKEP